MLGQSPSRQKACEVRLMNERLSRDVAPCLLITPSKQVLRVQQNGRSYECIKMTRCKIIIVTLWSPFWHWQQHEQLLAGCLQLALGREGESITYSVQARKQGC